MQSMKKSQNTRDAITRQAKWATDAKPIFCLLQNEAKNAIF